MTSKLSDFAARLREFINRSVPVTADASRLPSNTELGNRNLELETEFNAAALELFALQFTHNAPYRRICEAQHMSPRTIGHWAQIPAVPTAAFKEIELTCLLPAQRTRVFHSSGTTEQRPSRHFHNSDSLMLYETSLWPWFARNVVPGFRFQDSDCKLAVLTPAPDQAPHSSLVYMLEIVRSRLGASSEAFLGRVAADGSWTLDFDGTLRALQKACDSAKPLVLAGTAFSFVHLLDFLVKRNLRLQLPPGSRVMETGGYKGRSRSLPKVELHALITERLGIPPSHIVCEYGMSELSSQAYDKVASDEWPVARIPSRITHHASRCFHFPPWARVQIISPETGRQVAEGETGLLRVFDLANVFSVMAIQTEDLGVRRGDGFELIGRANFAEPRGCSLMTA